MTTTDTTATQPKRKPDLYVFKNRSVANESGPPVGAVFFHKKGKGFNIVFSQSREVFAAFPPKTKPAGEPPAEQAPPETQVQPTTQEAAA